MHELVVFIEAHQATFAVGGFWVFSALMSTMPPLSPTAGYWATWSYKFIQAVAANFNKHETAPVKGA